MSEIENLINSKREEVQNLIKNNKNKEVLDNLKELYTKIPGNYFNDFVADIFKFDPDFFNGKFSKKYNKVIEKLMGLEKALELESYIINKYCLYPEERIIGHFSGEANTGGAKMIGRGYITDFRIIFQGKSKGRGIPFITTGFLQTAIAKRIQNNILNKIKTQIDNLTMQSIPYFGDQYPLFGVYKKKLRSKKIEYKVKLGSRKLLFEIKPYSNTKEILKLLDQKISELNDSL